MELSNIDNEIATDKKPKSEEVAAVNTLNAQNPETAVTQSEALGSDVSRSLASEPSDEDYLRALGEMEPSGIPDKANSEMPSDNDYASALAEQTSDLQDKPRQTFDDVSSLSQDFDDVRAREVLEISKKLKIPQEEVIGLLQKHTYDELKNYKGLGDVTTAYPGLYNWAQDPKNYKVLIKNPEKIKRISDNNEFINSVGDETSRLAKSNWAQLYQVSLLTAMSTGKVDLNEGIRKLRELDLEIQNNQTKVYAESVKQLGESFSRLEGKFKQSGDIFATLKEDNLMTPEGKLAAIGKIYKGVTGSVEGMGDVLADIAKDPGAFAVGIAGQSLYSMAPSIAIGASVTKATTFLVGPFAGIAAGLTSGVATQAFISYGQSFQQSADKFRDKKTGLVNYEKMFKDPKVLEDLKIKASKYAAAHAIFEFIAGKFIKVDISKAKATIAANKALGLGKMATAKTVATTGAKSLAASSASEFAGETVAQVATGEPVSKALSEGFVEGISGSLFGVGQVGLEFYTAPAIDAKEASTLDIAKGAAEEVKTKVTTIKERVKNYREAREVRAKAEAAKTQAESVKDVREQMKGATSAEEKAQAQEMANAMNIFETEDGLVQTGATTINIEDLEKYSAKSGFPVATIVEALGESAQKSYNDSVNSGLKDFEVPVGDFEVGAIDFDGLEDIVYFNGSEVNAEESLEILPEADNVLAQMEESIDKEITLMQDDSQGTEPPIPNDASVNDLVGQFDQTGEDVVIVSRPVELMYRGKTREQMESFQKLLKRIRTASMGISGITPEMADIATELQYNNLRYRSEVTGIPLEKLTAALTFGKMKKDKGGALGTANVKIGEDGLSKAIKILFSPKADIATVVHELGHSWLQFMGDDTRIVQAIDPALLTDKQKEFLEVSKILADKLGLQSLSELSDLSENDMRRIQETFAQTVESYFLRNEAAPGRMKIVMNKLALWMSGVAERVLRKIGPLGAYPTLKVDDKVRRVLDTILRNTAVAESEFDDVFQGAIYDDRILGARKEEYKKILAEAREEAISKIYNKASDKSFAEREKLIDKELDKIYDDATAEVSQSTPIVFKNAIVNGPADQKITYESIQRLLANGDKAVTDQLISGFNRKMIAGQKKAGVDVSVYMAQLGISDPAQMVELLTQANNEQGLIDETANRMIDLLFPPMKTDQQIHEEAVKIVNSTLREKKVKLELKALADASPKKLAELAAIIAQPGANLNKEVLLDESIDSLGNKALQFISAQQVKTFSANRVLSIANRYGRKAAKYLAKGDFDAAFEMKEQEAMYVMAYKKALEVEKAISQTVKRFNKYRNMSDRNAAQKGLNPELIAYINVIDTVMNVGMNGGFPEIEIATVRGGQFVEPTYEQFVNDRIKAVNASSSYGPNTEINAVNFLLIGEIVKATAKQARQSLETHKILEGQKITDFAETVAEEIGTRKEGDPTGEIGVMDSRGADDFIAGLSADLQTIVNYFAALYPNEEAFAKSEIGKLLARVRDVEAEAQQNRDADWDILNERIKAIAKKDPTNRGLWKAIRRRLPLMRSQDLGKPIPAKDLNHTFSNKGEIIRLIALLGSESGRQAVIEGGLSQDESNIVPIGTYNPDTMLFESPALDAFIQECFENGTITKEDMDLVQAIWDINEKHFPAVKKSVQNQFHFPIGYIQPTPIMTPWGQYRGGYVPLHRALTLKRSKELVAKFTPNGFTTLSSDLLPFFTPSMAKERTGSPLPVSLDLSRLRADLNAIYRAGYMQESMAIVAKVFNEPSLRKALDSRRPGLLDNVLIPWVERTLSQKYSSEIESNTFNSGARVLQALRRNQAIQAFIFNPAAIAKQQLGVFPAAALVGQTRMYRSWFNTVRQRKQVIEAISKKSKFMERRFQTNQTRAIDSFEDFNLNYDQLSKMRDFTEMLTYLPIQLSQNLVDAATFLAAEEFAREKLKVSEKESSAYAETVVERSQGSTAVSSRPAILYWGGEYGRVLTAFGSQVLAMYGLNRSLRERVNVNNPDSRSKRLAELGYVIGMTILIPAIGAFMISNPAKTIAVFGDDEDEEDKKDYLKDMALDMTKEMVDVSVPFIGNPLITLALEGRQKATGEIPMARTVEATARTFGRAGSGVLAMGEELAEYGETDVNLSENEVRDLLTTITTLFGDPVSAVIRRALGEYSKIEDFIEEE